jgi:four helix bundle protein
MATSLLEGEGSVSSDSSARQRGHSRPTLMRGPAWPQVGCGDRPSEYTQRASLDLELDLDLVLDLVHRRAMNFRKLEVYQFAVRFLPMASEIAGALPQRHAGLADQLRRASLSIPLNIAEGSGKTTAPDQRRFYAMARGSAMECAAIIDACLALSLIERTRSEQADDLLCSIVRMLSKMCRE